MENKGFAIVTGGSRGLGKAMALRLASEGYDVVINYVSDNSVAKSMEVVEEIKKLGVEAIAVQADVSDYEQCSFSSSLYGRRKYWMYNKHIFSSWNDGS